jgi:hypothetical protein
MCPVIGLTGERHRRDKDGHRQRHGDGGHGRAGARPGAVRLAGRNPTSEGETATGQGFDRRDHGGAAGDEPAEEDRQPGQAHSEVVDRPGAGRGKGRPQDDRHDPQAGDVTRRWAGRHPGVEGVEGRHPCGEAGREQRGRGPGQHRGCGRAEQWDRGKDQRMWEATGDAVQEWVHRDGTEEPSATPVKPPTSPSVMPRTSTDARSWAGVPPTAASSPRSWISRRTPAAKAAATISTAIIRASAAMVGIGSSTPLLGRLATPVASSRGISDSPAPRSTLRASTLLGSEISQLRRASGPSAPRPVTTTPPVDVGGVEHCPKPPSFLRQARC